MNSRLDCTWIVPISIPPPNTPGVLNSLQAANRAESEKVHQAHVSGQAREPGEKDRHSYRDSQRSQAAKLRVPLLKNSTRDLTAIQRKHGQKIQKAPKEIDIEQVVHDEVDTKVRVIVGSNQLERGEVHVPSGDCYGAERELAGAAGGGGYCRHQDCEQQAGSRARGADGNIGETMAAVIVFIAKR
jgi:hypothetical protein